MAGAAEKLDDVDFLVAPAMMGIELVLGPDFNAAVGLSNEPALYCALDFVVSTALLRIGELPEPLTGKRFWRDLGSITACFTAHRQCQPEGRR